MSNSKKYLCIHGHFYQPPRENAWLETIEQQDSAAPFHDWNERINFECYAPNTAARILDDRRRILKIINNYTRISFNFGATLLSWMEMADPETYSSILKADFLSQAKFNGHGSAMAQVYSHLIMPLANEKDKKTQVVWGIRDFEYRFARKPESMWLAETAVNTETLETLAENGIKYTVLAPRQAKSIRRIGSENWQKLGHAEVDPRRPYLCQLPSGKSIALFFYDGVIAQSVAFKGLLNNGKDFAHQLLKGFDDRDEPQLVNIATDGESYGHHHRHGEMALADCLNFIEENKLATIINYGEYLEKFPPKYEVMIHENSSWSCVHGVERWQSDCGCNTGGKPEWNQKWRQPLRETLDWLRDRLLPIFKKEGKKLVKDIWVARNDYIEILLNRSPANIEKFIKRHAIKKLDEEEKTKLLRLLEMQRNAILMYTSCAWFFDEISGIETTQVLQYALRAIHYAAQEGQTDLRASFMKKLEKVPSNVYPNGAHSYEKHVLPSRLDLERVGMHYAVASIFEKYPNRLSLFNYEAENEVFERISAGIQKLVIGRTTVKSKVTHSEKKFSFAVLYLGQQNIIGNISTKMSSQVFNEMHDKIIEAFRSTNLGEVIGLMQTYFGTNKYTIWQLFKDEKRKILNKITEKSLQQAESAFRDIYNDNYQLMTGMTYSDIPIPEAYTNAVKHIVNLDLHRFFQQDFLNIRELRHLAREFKKWDIPISDKSSFKLEASERLFYEIKTIAYTEVTAENIDLINDIFTILSDMKIKLNIWKSQNIYFSILKKYNSQEIDFPNADWKDAFIRLGNHLEIKSVERILA